MGEGITTKTLIRLILATSPEHLIPYYTICIFAGLRQEEIFKLLWEDINLEENAMITQSEFYV